MAIERAIGRARLTALRRASTPDPTLADTQRRQCRLGDRIAEQPALRVQRLDRGFELLKFARHGRLKWDR